MFVEAGGVEGSVCYLGTVAKSRLSLSTTYYVLPGSTTFFCSRIEHGWNGMAPPHVPRRFSKRNSNAYVRLFYHFLLVRKCCVTHKMAFLNRYMLPAVYRQLCVLNGITEIQIHHCNTRLNIIGGYTRCTR